VVGGFGPHVVPAEIFLVTTAISQFISNSDDDAGTR
jgi:di/tricarboxylate transporter